MGFVVTYQGSVNRWECDENDHQNVRFYLAKAQQGLTLALQHWQIAKPSACAAIATDTATHHIRFLREARVAVPLRIDCGVLSTTDKTLQVLSQMVHASSGERLATFVSDLPLDAHHGNHYAGELVDLPEDAGSRGLPTTDSCYASLTQPEALQHGFAQIGAGVIGPIECNRAQQMEPHVYIGRISDGMPNLWGNFRYDASASDADDAFSGGAVLEYRLRIHHPLRAGDSYAHLAGIQSTGRKTLNICHLLYNTVNGTLAASADALSIAMDLQTRRSMIIPEEQRERISALLLQPIAA